LREKFNELAEQLCISSITLGELHCGAEKSPRRAQNLTALEHFAARLQFCLSETKLRRTTASCEQSWSRRERLADRTTCRSAATREARA
jgi:predicted nucleic acid-binding protein